MTEKISVIVTGATGVAGSGVLKACLDHPAVEKVSVITRSSTGQQHQKLVEVIHNDFLDYSSIEDTLSGHDACFWCLGVSQMQVRREEDYHRITYQFTMEAAIVHLADIFCRALNIGYGGDDKIPSLDVFAWESLKIKASAIEPIIEVMKNEFDDISLFITYTP